MQGAGEGELVGVGGGADARDVLQPNGNYYTTAASPQRIGTFPGALTAGALSAAIDRTVSGASIDAPVWTGTDPSGQAAPITCSGWTSLAQNGQIGRTSRAGQSWTANGVAPCSVVDCTGAAKGQWPISSCR